MKLSLILEEIKYDSIQNTDDMELIEKYSKIIDHNIRACIAKNKNTPIQILKKLANDPSLLVRLAVVQNKNWVWDNE